MWDSFKAVFYKEWLHIRRDRATVLMTLMIPMIQLMVYGWMDTNVRHFDTSPPCTATSRTRWRAAGSSTSCAPRARSI
jgi:hypothetical protein